MWYWQGQKRSEGTHVNDMSVVLDFIHARRKILEINMFNIGHSVSNQPNNFRWLFMIQMKHITSIIHSNGLSKIKLQFFTFSIYKIHTIFNNPSVVEQECFTFCFKGFLLVLVWYATWKLFLVTNKNIIHNVNVVPTEDWMFTRAYMRASRNNQQLKITKWENIKMWCL